MLSEKDMELKSQQILQRAASLLESPSPYLKTRVLAELRERRAGRRSVGFWKTLAAVATAASVASAVVLISFTSGFDFEAATGQPYAVRVDLKPTGEAGGGIRLARIRLPEGVRFYSASFPELREQRSLVLEWSAIAAKGALPFVIESDVAGTRTIQVEFLDESQVLVARKEVTIRFREVQEKGV